MKITSIVKRSQRAKTARRLLIGLLGGTVATGPMTIAMLELHKLLGRSERQPLPPREITAKLAKVTGVDDHLNSTEISTLTLLNHFAYGSAAGGGYTLIMPDPLRRSVPKGLLYGLFVWGVSYLGLLPGLNVLKPATKHSARRTCLMIFVHLVWGVVLAVFVRVVLGETKRAQGALLGGSALPHFDAT